jgi:hypothetical protein
LPTRQVHQIIQQEGRTGRKQFLFKIEEEHDLTAGFRKGTGTADRTGEFPELK